MGNTSSERAGLERHGHKGARGDSSGGAIGTKEGDRPKILMDSPEDADLFHSEEMKVLLLPVLLVWNALGLFAARRDFVIEFTQSLFLPMPRRG